MKRSFFPKKKRKEKNPLPLKDLWSQRRLIAQSNRLSQSDKQQSVLFNKVTFVMWNFRGPRHASCGLFALLFFTRLLKVLSKSTYGWDESWIYFFLGVSLDFLLICLCEIKIKLHLVLGFFFWPLPFKVLTTQYRGGHLFSYGLWHVPPEIPCHLVQTCTSLADAIRFSDWFWQVPDSSGGEEGAWQRASTGCNAASQDSPRRPSKSPNTPHPHPNTELSTPTDSNQSVYHWIQTPPPSHHAASLLPLWLAQ